VDLPLVGLGYYLSHTKLAAQYESQFLSVILYLPIVLLVGGLIALVWRWWSRRKPGVQRVRQTTGPPTGGPFLWKIVAISPARSCKARGKNE
jgi:hypothetical protein